MVIAAIVVLLVIAVAVLAVRLRAARRRTRTATRRLALATGHPSASGLGRAGWEDRRALADVVAHRLATMGLVAERRNIAPIVYAQAAAGEYVVTIASAGRVIVDYRTGDDVIELGEFPGINGALREIAAHADRPAVV